MVAKDKSNHGNCRPVVLIELNRVFPSVDECGLFIRGCPSGISNVLSGRRKKHKGYSFRWADEA